MLRVILYTLIAITLYYGIKIGINLLAAKFSIFSKFGAIRLAINPKKTIARGASIIWKIIKYGTAVIALMTTISLMLR